MRPRTQGVYHAADRGSGARSGVHCAPTAPRAGPGCQPLVPAVDLAWCRQPIWRPRPCISPDRDSHAKRDDGVEYLPYKTLRVQKGATSINLHATLPPFRISPTVATRSKQRSAVAGSAQPLPTPNPESRTLNAQATSTALSWERNPGACRGGSRNHRPRHVLGPRQMNQDPALLAWCISPASNVSQLTTEGI